MLLLNEHSLIVSVLLLTLAGKLVLWPVRGRSETQTQEGQKIICSCLLSVSCKMSCMLWPFPCCLAYWCLLKMEKHLRNVRKTQTSTHRRTKSRTGIFLFFSAFPYASNDMSAHIYSCQDPTLYSWYVTVLFFDLCRFYSQIERCFLSEFSYISVGMRFKYVVSLL